MYIFKVNMAVAVLDAPAKRTLAIHLALSVARLIRTNSHHSDYGVQVALVDGWSCSLPLANGPQS